MAFQELYQNDSRWKNNVIGFGTNQTIEYFGCLLTSMTMIGNYFGGSETPASLNERLKQSNGFRDQFVRPATISTVFGNIKYQYNEKKPVSLQKIDAGLAAGSLVAVMVDYETRPGLQGHWVVIHKKEGNDYHIWDPWPKADAPKTLNGRYGFSGGPTDIIHEAIWFGKGDFPPPNNPPAHPPAVPPPPKAAPPPTSGSSFVVEPFVQQLTLRQQPNTNAAAIKSITQGTDLVVLEPAATAQAKIGQQNQWLQVRDASGAQGYVAAWYVTTSNDPVAGVHEQPPAPPTATGISVKTTGDSVALRREPRAVPETLIRLLTKGTVLTVTEGGNAAAKIGQQNQWLQVKASDGTAGYVAAWFVAQA